MFIHACIQNGLVAPTNFNLSGYWNKRIFCIEYGKREISSNYYFFKCY